MVTAFGRVPYARLPPRPWRCHAVRLPEIRFEGLVGLTPPLSCSLPQQTSRLFGCAAPGRRPQCNTVAFGPSPTVLRHALIMAVIRPVNGYRLAR